MNQHDPQPVDPANEPGQPNPYSAPSGPVDADPGAPQSEDDRNMAVIAHASGIIGALGVGWIGWIGPLIVYLMKQKDSHYVATQAKEALNFQITMLLFGLALGALAILTCGIALPIVIPLAFIPPILQIVFGIIATLKVKDGHFYRYPLTIRLIR